MKGVTEVTGSQRGQIGKPRCEFKYETTAFFLLGRTSARCRKKAVEETGPANRVVAFCKKHQPKKEAKKS